MGETVYDIKTGMDTLCKQLVGQPSVLKGKWVAITDNFEFIPQQKENDLDKFLATGLFECFSDHKVKLVEKKKFDAILAELKLNTTDLFNPENRKRFGKFFQTDLLLLGEIFEFPETIKVSIRLVDIETRSVVRRGSVYIEKNKEIKGLLGIIPSGRLRVLTEPESSIMINGSMIGRADYQGAFSQTLPPGDYSLKVERYGYRPEAKSIVVLEDKETVSKVDLDSLLPNTNIAVALAILIPGAGNLYLGHDYWWLYTAAIGGSIYGAYYYSDKTEEYIRVTDKETGKTHIEKRGELPVYLFGAFAGWLWLKSIQDVKKSAERLHAPHSFDIQYNPEQRVARLTFSIKW